MYKLMIVFTLLGVVNHGLGLEPSAVSAAKIGQQPEASRLTNDSHGIGQQILLDIRVVEISRTKLQQLGFDFERFCWSQGRPNIDALDDSRNSKNADSALRLLNGKSPYPDVLASTDPFFKVLDALRKDRLAKIVAEPTLMTRSNRPASFHVGSQSRVVVPQGNGKVSIEEKPYGTSVDAVTVLLDDQTIHLTCRIEVSQLDLTNGVVVAGKTVPALKNLRIETTGNCRSGQTIVRGGLRQNRRISSATHVSDVSTEAVPKSDDKPTAKEVAEEIETLLLLTPEIVEPMLSEKGVRIKTRR